MSMLSAQCDELRERAATLRQGRWSDGVDDARLMEDAADTIWELRDDLQRSNAENAKLRERVDAAHMSRLLTENENEKLRELCADMWGTMDLLDACGVDEYDEPLNCCTGCNQYGSVDEFAGGKRVIGCKLMYRMSELGVD